MLPLQFIPLVAAALVPMIVGAVWYHPRIFGARWMSFKHITPEMANRSAMLQNHTTAVMIALGFLCALALRMIIAAFKVDSLFDALVTAFGLWIAFTVPSTINRVLWDHVPFQLYCIESGQWLASFALMALILVY